MLMLGDNIVPRKPAARCTPIGLSQSVNQPVHHLVERRRLSEVSSGRVWLRHGSARRPEGWRLGLWQEGGGATAG